MGNNHKKLRVGVFIDGSNIYRASKDMDEAERWWVDFGKFKTYLKDRYAPVLYRYYGITDDNPTTDHFTERAAAQKKFYARLEGMGYDVITKPLKYMKDDDGKVMTKGDMDIEVTMGIIESLADLDMIVLVSGDSDYYTAVQNFHAQGKYIWIYSFEHTLAWELKTFAFKQPRCNYLLFDALKEKLSYQKSVDKPKPKT